ncbi:TraC family protein [Orientia tsutsugamushi]|uniref:TraC family protein n=1 Tax=Orientia tsutsugamushi TaxID=784 RepID=UPI00123A474F|nr:TraC family protein [Orientia tsutsugamushi]QES95914.1 TraC family protein [Orientia tsutsugamushi]QES96260.1 TraC family protein [Orientia tsutsugamushi]
MNASIHKDFDRERFSKHFVYESYDDETQLFFNRGSIGFVLLAWPLVGASVSAQNEIAEFLKSDENLPAESSLQVLMIGSNNIENFLSNWQSYRKGEIFIELANKRTEFLRDQAQKSGSVKDVVLLISVTIPNLNANIDDMIRRRDALKDTFRSIGLSTENVNAQQLLKFLRVIFGWPEEEHSNINQYEILSEQILSGDFSLFENDDCVNVNDDQIFISLEARKRPAEWKLSAMDLFLGNEMRRDEYIKSNFLIHFGLQILPNQAMERTAAITKREALERNINAGMGKFFPDIQQEAADLASVVAALQSGDRVVNIHFNVIMFDKTKKAKQSASAFCSMLRRSGWYFVPCKYDHVAVLLAALPMQLVEQGPKGILGQKTSGVGVALSSLGRGIKTVSVESKVLLPIIGEWKGDLSSPGMLLAGRRGQIMYWSPFGGALLPALNKHGVAPNENFNLCIAGVPGSGKSVFMQELMLSVLGVGGKVFVLDYGRSFKRTCLILGGRYIEFDMKNPVSINPFSEVPEDDSAKSIEARSDFLSNFPSILATMAAPQYGTSDLQQPMLQRALISVWQKNGAKAEITDIADWLSNREESYAKELGNMLFPFTKDGQHGRFFSGKAQLSLNSDIVVIETDHLRSVPELLAVIVQIMIVHINQTMVKGDRSRPFLIMIDEAWKLLAGKRSGEFIEEAGRIARKYNGSIALATQQLTDYFHQEGSASEKAFENSSHKIILKQNSESFKAMRANPKLAGFVDEDWKLNLLQSVHSNPPYYSEIAIYSPNVSGVIGRLMIDPFTLLLTSTNARDYQAIEDHMAKGMNVSEAINHVIKELEIIP